MAASSIDTLGYWPWLFGQPVLPTIVPNQIPIAGSANFTFPAPAPRETGEAVRWVGTMHVVKHRGGPDLVTPRIIPMTSNGLYNGILTTEETENMTDGWYFLVMIFTAIDREIERFVRFQIRTPWVVNP